MAKSDVQRAFAEDGARKTHIGGQALIEGVMMRGTDDWAVCVREPSGNLFSEVYPLSKKGNRPAWFSWPLVRGCVALIDSLVLGYKALEIAANHALIDEDDEIPPAAEATATAAVEPIAAPTADPAAEPTDDSRDALSQPPLSQLKDDNAFGGLEMAISLVLGIALGLALFIFLPAFASNLIVGNYEDSPLLWNVADGVLRVAIFIFYVWLIGRMKDIYRMFEYHGAEHKTIHCYEHGLPLTPENARQFPRLHVRCGTAFLIMVMIIAILVYTIIPMDWFFNWAGIDNNIVSFLLLLALRILFMPVIAGIAYEITVKWAGSHPENKLVQVVLWPGLQMQRLTTHEPDDAQLECAIRAMQLVLDCEESARQQQ